MNRHWLDKLIDRLDEWSAAFFIIILIAFTVWFILFYQGCSHKPDRVVGQEIKAKMSYHGIDACFEDWKGNLYFIRNGKQVKI